MNVIGRARNARINQAIKYGTEVLANLRLLAGFPMNEHLDLKDQWADARNALEQLTQCVHESNAYNNAMKSRQPAGQSAGKISGMEPAIASDAKIPEEQWNDGAGSP